MPYLIDITLQLERGVHGLLGGAPFVACWTLDVLQHDATAAFVLVHEKEHGVPSFVGRRPLEEGVHAGQGDVVTVKVVRLIDIIYRSN